MRPARFPCPFQVILADLYDPDLSNAGGCVSFVTSDLPAEGLQLPAPAMIDSSMSEAPFPVAIAPAALLGLAGCAATHPIMPTTALYTGPQAKPLFTDALAAVRTNASPKLMACRAAVVAISYAALSNGALGVRSARAF